MTFGTDKTQKTTTTGAAENYIPGLLGDMNSVYNQGKNRQHYQGDVLAPLNADTQNAFNMTRSLAGQPVQGLNEANNYNTGLIANGGWTDELRGAASGIQSNMDQTAQYLNPFMTGQYQEDPRLQAQLDINANRAANGAATRFGGGRYGSAAIGQGVGTAVADANNGIMLQSNENSRNRQLQSIGMNSGVQMQGGGLLGNMAEGARGSALQAGSMLPMLDNLKYAGAERVAGIGDYLQNRSQTEKDANIQNFNDKRTNAYNWGNINQYMGGLTGLGSQSKTTVAPKPGSTAQSAIGGALAGATLGNKVLPGGWGTAIGGLGGGLLGAWG